MQTILSIVFIAGYAAIVSERTLRINKTASALLLSVVCWILYSVSATNHETVLQQLGEHLAAIAEILFFLLGAMTIVEVIDEHKGFRLVTAVINTQSKRKLLWIISGIAFFLSAVLDNLTTAIVMVSLLRKIVEDKRERMIMAGMVIIAANAGGAWSPIGDVTTTMLWMGGQITAVSIMKQLFIPSMISLLIPLIYQSFYMRGTIASSSGKVSMPPAGPYSRFIFFLGLFSLLSIPVFKTMTGLPPYLGILFALGIIWLVTEIIHAPAEEGKHLRVSHILTKIDHTSLLFFLGILLAIAAIESVGTLAQLSTWLAEHVRNQITIVTMLGLISSVIDNVPLVAATMGMYPLEQFPRDHKIWEMIAYCAGTGGSILIIGSAAGVVVMGMERIEFFWYLKHIGLPALLGYFAGIAAYLLIYSM
jgi:NhaD family Na+/H+ antiporter